jgi:hypothetical protein
MISTGLSIGGTGAFLKNREDLELPGQLWAHRAENSKILEIGCGNVGARAGGLGGAQSHAEGAERSGYGTTISVQKQHKIRKHWHCSTHVQPSPSG